VRAGLDNTQLAPFLAEKTRFAEIGARFSNVNREVAEEAEV